MRSHIPKLWSRPHKIPLWLALMVPFVCLTGWTIGVVGYLSYRSGQHSVENLANQLLRQTSERVSDRLHSYLQLPQQTVAANHLAWEQGTLDTNNPEQLRQQLWQQMILNPSLPASGFWSDDGIALGYVRMASEEERSLAEKVSGQTIPLGTVFFNEIRPNQRRYYWIDSQGKPRKLVYQFKDDFRTVAWYRHAKTINQQSWTPVSFARVIPLLQTIVFSPIHDVSGKFQGVFTTNYFLSEISDFLNQLHLSPTGQVFIMERSGDLVATSIKAEALGVRKIDGKPVRLSALNSQDRGTREVSTQLIQQFGNFDHIKEPRQLSLMVAGQRQFVQITPYSEHYSLEWHIVTVIPESDFMKEIQANTYQTLLLCGLALMGSVGFGIWTSRWLARSLSRLTQATQIFTQKRLEQTLPDTRIAEVEILTEAFRSMMIDLQVADRLRLNYEQDLEQQVAEKTAALREAQRIARMGSWEFDVATGVSTWSVEQFRIFGFDLNVSLPNFDLNVSLPNYASFLDLIPLDDQPKLRTAVDEAIAHGIPYTIEHGIICPDGSIRHIISRGEAVFNEQGQVIKLVGTIIDISDRKQLELDLQLSESKLNDILNSASAAITRIQFTVDGKWDISYVSKGCETISGYSPAELIADQYLWYNCINPEDYANFQDQIYADIFAQNSGTYIYRFTHKDGSQRWISQTTHSRWDDKQNVYVVTFLTTDVSDHKRIELELVSSRDLREAIYNESTDATFLCNSVNRIVLDCNRRAVEMFEANHKDELINIYGNTLQKLQFTHEEMVEINEEMDTLGFWSREIEYITKKGNSFWGNLALKRINIGGQVMNLVRVTDVSDRHRIDQMKSEFISVVSHELRTPLTSIHGALNLLSEGLIEPQSERGQRTIAIAAEAADRLSRLVNDILDSERLESGKVTLQKQPCNVTDLSNTAIELMRVFANNVGVNLKVSTLAISVDADPDKIIQVLTNLLSNAIKFSPENSTVWLTSGFL